MEIWNPLHLACGANGMVENPCRGSLALSNVRFQMPRSLCPVEIEHGYLQTRLGWTEEAELGERVGVVGGGGATGGSSAGNWQCRYCMRFLYPP